MDIFMLVNERLNTDNAVKTHVLEIFHNLAELYEISLFLPYSEVDLPQNENIIHYSRHTVPVPVIHKIVLQMSQFASLFKLCRQKKPDIIYSRFANYSFSPPVISKMFNIPLILEINGILRDEAEITEPSIVSLLVSRFILKLSELMNYYSARKIIAVTPGIRAYLQDTYRCTNVEVLPNGVNTTLFRPMDQSMARRKSGLNDDEKCVCFVGNLERWQGVEYLIMASEKILKHHPETNFVIVGEGNVKHELIALAERLEVAEHFRFTGRIPYEEVPDFINSSDVCIAPFIRRRNEVVGLSPLKLFEYLSCGKPVITTNIAGANDIVIASCAGIVVEPENPDELSGAVLTILQNDDLAHRMGMNGRAFILNGHSWESVAKRIGALCQTALSG